MKSYKSTILAALVVLLIASVAVHFVHMQSHTLTAERWRNADSSDRQMLLGSLLQDYAYPGASKQALEEVMMSPYVEMTQQLRDTYFPGTEDAAQIHKIASGSVSNETASFVYTYLAVFYEEDVITGSYIFTTNERIEK